MSDKLEERLHQLIVDLRSIQEEYATRREEAASTGETTRDPRQRVACMNDAILAAGYAGVLEGVITQLVGFWGLEE